MSFSYWKTYIKHRDTFVIIYCHFWHTLLITKTLEYISQLYHNAILWPFSYTSISSFASSHAWQSMLTHIILSGHNQYIDNYNHPCWLYSLLAYQYHNIFSPQHILAFQFGPTALLSMAPARYFLVLARYCCCGCH